MSELVEKVIGATYVVHNDQFFLADIYEGNFYKIMDGGVVKTTMLPKKEYERVLMQYQECLEKDIMITSAYELNKRANISFEVPKVSADPKAAEKEWYLRKHPHVVPQPEPKKKGIFGRRKKKKVKIKCLECGAINLEGQKFCGECGHALLTAETEIGDVKEVEKPTDTKEPVETPTVLPEPDEGIEIIEIDEKEETPIKDAGDSKPVKEEKEPVLEPKKAKKKVKRVFLILLSLLLMMLLAAAAYLYLFYGSAKNLIYDSTKETAPVVEEAAAQAEEMDVQDQSYVVVKVKVKIAQNEKIVEEDLEGTILSYEQYEKYNALSTYIDKEGNRKTQTLILWEDRSDVIGKYAARELSAGTILYDASVTTEHVVADKTYVDVEVDGEKKTYESKTDVMPGNTKIQIIALIQTDGSEPSQVLLSEMTLQDRSLESIFDSAGQDILEMLSETEEETDSVEEDGQITTEGTEGESQ